MQKQHTVNTNKYDNKEIISLTSQIASAYFSNHKVELDDIHAVISNIYDSINTIAIKQTDYHTPKPAVPVDQSVHDDFIICLEDGKKLKMLKRYIKSTYNLSPEEYRRRWNLKPEYPMVAPNYAKKRSSLALQIGLGKEKK